MSKKLAEWAADSVTVQEDDTRQRTTFRVSAVVAEAPWSVAEWAVVPRFDIPRSTVQVLLLG